MRIIYVTASLPYGTQEAFIIAEVNALMRLGHEVLLVPRSPRGHPVHALELRTEAVSEGLGSMRVLLCAMKSFIRAPRQVGKAVKYLWQSRSFAIALKNMMVIPKALWLADLSKKWGASHIHCHWAATTATMTLVASQLSKVPWSFTAHRWDIVENNLLTTKAECASFVRVISNETMKMAAARGVEVNEKLRVLRMGVNMPESTPWKRPSSLVLICPANLVEVKGHRFLIEAWRVLCNRGIRGELWLAGTGELKLKLQAMIEKLDLQASIKLLGALPHSSLLKLYETHAVSAVVLASIDLGNGCHEGIPVALVEAMSYGIPVVSTETGAIGELVLPGTGLLVPPQDPVALANAIELILKDEQFAAQVGSSGRLRAGQAHDIKTIATVLQNSFVAAHPRTSTA
jgi:glycosyltransferase involved in cell wall biosynthesis